MNIVPMRLLLIFAGLLVSNYSSAAPDPPPPPAPPLPPGLPVDGGLFVVLLVTLFFAFYKIQSYKKRAAN